jgi:hypothetical protein
MSSRPHRTGWREIDGIGPVRAASILAAWAEQKAVREIMVFLHSRGVGTARAVRIFRTYGPDAIQVMTENPIGSRTSRNNRFQPGPRCWRSLLV